MSIIFWLLLLAAGFLCLVKGADMFVDGSCALARRFKVSGLIIGLTIVALGTSAPELAVSTSAALVGSNEIALSNVVGSNIFNLLGVLGISAIVSPLPVDKAVLKRDFPFSIVMSAALPFLICVPAIAGGELSGAKMYDEVGTVTSWLGGLLVTIFVAYIAFMIHTAKRRQEGDEGAAEVISPLRFTILIAAGLALIIAGGQATVYAAKAIARAAGMTETLIGVTIVAIGTSLPELVTSVVAAKKGETGLALGNAIGSNIFNLLFILGVSALIHPVAVNMASVYDMAVLLFISGLTYLFALSAKRIVRAEGVVMVCIYAAQTVFAIMR